MKARCRKCNYLDFDLLHDQVEIVDSNQHFCGLHGRAIVNPDGEQPNLNNHGSCGFSPRIKAVQLTLDFSADFEQCDLTNRPTLPIGTCTFDHP